MIRSARQRRGRHRTGEGAGGNLGDVSWQPPAGATRQRRRRIGRRRVVDDIHGGRDGGEAAPGMVSWPLSKAQRAPLCAVWRTARGELRELSMRTAVCYLSLPTLFIPPGDLGGRFRRVSGSDPRAGGRRPSSRHRGAARRGRGRPLPTGGGCLAVCVCRFSSRWVRLEWEEMDGRGNRSRATPRQMR